MTEPDALAALARITGELAGRGKPFCIVGGFGVSLRGEVRFTRDVDVAVFVNDDREAESLARDLGATGYRVVALVEHDERGRLATMRLRSPSGVTVDLLLASSGIEPEAIARATPVVIEGVGAVAVAQAEELVAMKILSMEARRPQDRSDAIKLIEINDGLDLHRVRDDLRLIESRGFHRGQDLLGKLEALLASVA